MPDSIRCFVELSVHEREHNIGMQIHHRHSARVLLIRKVA